MLIMAKKLTTKLLFIITMQYFKWSSKLECHGAAMQSASKVFLQGVKIKGGGAGIRPLRMKKFLVSVLFI